jgi:hypothetical protein
MSNLDRRAFQTRLLGSALTFSLLETLWGQDLFAADVKPDIGKWFADLNAIGQDLKGLKLKDIEFQAKMEDLYRKVDLPALLRLVDLDKIAERKLPDSGASSAGFDLGKVEGLGKATFGKQIFGLKKGCAVVPHGHINMCTGFIVLRGTFRGRHYDRLETNGDHFIIKPTIDQEFKAGGLSTISDHKDNVHWFACQSDTGFIFNAHFNGYDPSIAGPGGRIYLDPEGEKLQEGLIKAKKMTSSECHKKYGFRG